MRGTDEITNSQDIIDSRDVIDRISYLEDERSTLSDEVENMKETYEDAIDPTSALSRADKKEAKENWQAAIEKLKDWDESDEGQELKALQSLQDEASSSSDWKHGEALIRDSYFQDYARQTAEDCGMLKDSNTWPGRCIDWEQAADELKQDYSSVDFDGVDYWIRS